MRKSKYSWKIHEKEQLPDDFLNIITNEKIHPLVGQILWSRGIRSKETLESFLYPSVNHLHDPFLLHDMDKTIERIQTSVENGEKILVYGDYDADGITSTTVMKEALELIGGEVVYFLPDRFKHGYGPNQSVFEEQIDRQGVQLIITVDNGVSGHEAIELANQKGVDVIITDHHELPPVLPNAYSIVHPKHPDGNYPFKELAGVGVAFKVATALLGEIPMELLDLVAIGTVADLVSLTDENRILTQMGIEMLRISERIGLDHLYMQAEINKATIDEETIGFVLAPRLNAIGRLGDATPGVELLTTFDEEKAATIVQQIEHKNDERKEIVATIEKEAFSLLNPKDSIHVLAKSGWHEGVLGIVAGKIMKETGKPAIVLALDEQTQVAKGSGRSVSALNLFDVLNENAHLLTYFGGHHMAAGMTLPRDNIDKLKQTIEQYIDDKQIDLSQGQELLVDEEISIEEVTIAFIDQLKKIAPFGINNTKPTFLFNQVVTEQLKRIGADQSHLKFQIKHEQGKVDAVAFQMGKAFPEFEQSLVTIVGQLSINEWNGHKKVQVMVSDYAVEEMQIFDMRGKKGHYKPIEPLKTLYICFNQKNLKELENLETSSYYYEGNDQEFLNIYQTKAIEQLCFLDCPEEEKIVKHLVEISQCHRVYIMFETKEDAYIDGAGSREQFAKLYKFIQQQSSVDVRYKLANVSKYLQLPEKLLIYMIQVFLDLEFITIDAGMMKKVNNPTMKDLQTSSVYQKRLQQIKIEEFLLYTDSQTIKKWLSTEEENIK